MKKLFFLFLSLLISISVIANNLKYHSVNTASVFFKHSRAIADTLVPSSFIDTASGGLGCDTVFSIIDIDAAIDSGYITGTNIFNDLEKGQHFAISDFGYQSVSINKVIAHFGIAQTSFTSGYVFAKIYSTDSNGFPDSLLSSSDSIAIADLALLINGVAEFNFPAPVSISNSFAVSIDFSNCLTDIVALKHTEQNCFSESGSSIEKWNDLTWHHMNFVWQFETDLALFPVLTDGVLLGSSAIQNEILIKVFPNPSNDIITIYSNDLLNEVAISDVTGRNYYYTNVIGTSRIAIEVSGYANGIYFLRTKSGSGLNNIVKIIVQH